MSLAGPLHLKHLRSATLFSVDYSGISHMRDAWRVIIRLIVIDAVEHELNNTDGRLWSR